MAKKIPTDSACVNIHSVKKLVILDSSKGNLKGSTGITIREILERITRILEIQQQEMQSVKNVLNHLV